MTIITPMQNVIGSLSAAEAIIPAGRQYQVKMVIKEPSHKNALALALGTSRDK
jgi:hypothetical protein